MTASMLSFFTIYACNRFGLFSGTLLNPSALASGPKFSFYVSTFIT